MTTDGTFFRSLEQEVEKITFNFCHTIVELFFFDVVIESLERKLIYLHDDDEMIREMVIL